MFTLAFDTTGRSCSIALLNNNKVISTFNKVMDFGQAEVLIPEIKTILAQNSLAFNDIGLLVVCVGPGSFTGVRASISAARSFKIACPELSLAGLSAFEVYMSSLPQEERSALNLVVIETKREDFYYQIFDAKAKPLTPPLAAPREEIIKQLQGKKMTITGDGVERFLYTPSGLGFNFIKTPDAISIEALAALGLQKLKNKSLDFPKPLYIRAADVCTK